MDNLIPLLYMIAGAGILGLGFFLSIYFLSEKESTEDIVETFNIAPLTDTSTAVNTKLKTNDDEESSKNTFYQ